MITKFELFIEKIGFNDMKNAINLNIEMGEQTPQKQGQQPNSNDDIKNTANTNITNLQNYINNLQAQKQKISEEIVQLENAQRDLVPNNPTDPNNDNNIKTFIDSQKAKIENNRKLLSGLEEKIKLFQDQISTNKEKYL